MKCRPPGDEMSARIEKCQKAFDAQIVNRSDSTLYRATKCEVRIEGKKYIQSLRFSRDFKGPVRKAFCAHLYLLELVVLTSCALKPLFCPFLLSYGVVLTGLSRSLLIAKEMTRFLLVDFASNSCL
jgi:hypothetical protein